MEASIKLCILRLSAIGDVCHAAAMVNALLKAHQNLYVTWIIGKVEHELLQGMERVRFVVFDKKGGRQAKAAVKQALANEEFDALCVMQVALRANLLSTVVNAKRRVGFDWARSKEGHYLFCNERVKAHPQAHVLEGFMDFATNIGLSKVAPPTWDIPVSQRDKGWVSHYLANDGIDESTPFCVISPAASKAERNWLPERYAACAEHLNERGQKVVLCGGPGPLDASLREQILAKTDKIDCDLVGKTTLKQMLEVLGRAALVIAPDTGPAHMATTQGTPVVGLYAHSNPRRTGPYLSQDLCASVYDECIQEQFGKPWQALPWGKRAKGEDLMTRIEVEPVLALIDKALS